MAAEENRRTKSGLVLWPEGLREAMDELKVGRYQTGSEQCSLIASLDHSSHL